MKDPNNLSKILEKEIEIIEKELEHIQTYNIPLIPSVLVTMLFIYFLIAPSNMSLDFVKNVLINSYPLAIILAFGVFILSMFSFLPLFNFPLNKSQYEKELYTFNEIYTGIYLGLVILVILLISYSSALILNIVKSFYSL